MIKDKIQAITLQNSANGGIIGALVAESFLSPQNIIDEVLSLLIVGTETASATSTWMLHLLSFVPTVQKKTLLEIRRSQISNVPLIETISQLHYSKAVIQETLRLYPPAWAMIRCFHEPFITQNNIEIPSGSVAWAVPVITHRDPEFWPNPDEFNPERFLPGAISSYEKYSYFPFGGGFHKCIAERFSLMEAQIILLSTLSCYTLRTTEKK